MTSENLAWRQTYGRKGLPREREIGAGGYGVGSLLESLSPPSGATAVRPLLEGSRSLSFHLIKVLVHRLWEEGRKREREITRRARV